MTSHRQPAVDQDDTVQLIRRARLGDLDARERLFERHVPELRRWASGRLPRWARDAADTSDLVQDTIVQTLKNLDAFEPRGEAALQAYLRQAIVNRIRNALRKASGRPAASPLDSQMPASEVSPLEAAVGAEILEKYEAGLARLSEDERGALVGRIEIGLSYADLAAAMGRPSADAARMLVVRALAKLAREMDHSR